MPDSLGQGRTGADKPRAMTLQEVVMELNQRAHGQLIGSLPEWRRTRDKLDRVPSALFYAKVKPGRDYVFHIGGREELQFNIGFEDYKILAGKKTVRKTNFRHGVAFSLEPSRTLPDPTVLRPNIERFNEFMRIYPDAFPDLRMWYWRGGDRSSEYPITPIPDELVKVGNFIFIGRPQPVDAIDVGIILDDFDRLLPLYQFVEGTESFPSRKGERTREPFTWPSSGEGEHASGTSYQRAETTVEVNLRHNAIQDALLGYLRKVHGADNATREFQAVDGTRIDVAVRDGGAYTYYEIKVYSSARACIREALGQLLEYSYWPGAQKADRLVVVGEALCDDDAQAYIKSLRKAFSLPLEYRQFDMEKRRLA